MLRNFLGDWSAQSTGGSKRNRVRSECDFTKIGPIGALDKEKDVSFNKHLKQISIEFLIAHRHLQNIQRP
jgi:hypothetical protein